MSTPIKPNCWACRFSGLNSETKELTCFRRGIVNGGWNLGHAGDNLPPDCQNRERFKQAAGRTPEGHLLTEAYTDAETVQIFRDQGRSRSSSPTCWACLFAGADPETKELECIKKGVSPYPSWNLSRTGDNLPPGCKNREHFIQHPARTPEGCLFKLHLEDPRLVQIYRDQGRSRPSSCWPCQHSRAGIRSKSLVQSHAEWEADALRRGWRDRPLPPSKDVLEVEREALEKELPIRAPSQHPTFQASEERKDEPRTVGTISESAKEALRASTLDPLARIRKHREERDNAMADRVAEKLRASGSNQSLGASGREFEEQLRRGVRSDLVKAEGEIRALLMRVETLEKAVWGLVGGDSSEKEGD